MTRARTMGSTTLEALVQSGALVGGVAVALLHACAAALGGDLPWRATVVVAAGTLAVYAFDRRVDDHVDRPAREAFARRHGRALSVVAGGFGLLAAIVGLTLSPPAIALLASVVALAALHARLRRLPWIKPVYVAVAWLAVVVVLPAVLLAAPAARAAAELVPVGLAVLANVIACDAIDREAEARTIGSRGAWWVARALAAAGACVGALTGPTALALVPAAALVSVLPYRPRPEHTPVLDAALGVGALLAWGTLRV